MSVDRTLRLSTNSPASHAPARGRLVVDLVLVAALVVLSVAIVAPALDSARQRDRLRAVAAEARSLHDGFQRYHERNRAFPELTGVSPFQTDILEMLRRSGYYTGEIAKYLDDGRVDAYDAPRDEGGGREFWVEMTLVDDSSLRILVARSDDAPLGRGKWMDGAFLLRGGKLEPL